MEIPEDSKCRRMEKLEASSDMVMMGSSRALHDSYFLLLLDGISNTYYQNRFSYFFFLLYFLVSYLSHL